MTARIEDNHLLTGDGNFLDDDTPENCLVMCVLRSPVAHGQIRRLDINTAQQSDGVVAIITAQDLLGQGIGPLNCRATVNDISGQPMREPLRNILATGKVVYVGQPVAAVIATTTSAAMDALDAIELEIDDLPAVVDVTQASTKEAIWPEIPENRSFTWHLGNTAESTAAFGAATHVFEVTVAHPRIAIAPIETRGCLASYDAATKQFQLVTPSQGVVSLRAAMSECLGVDLKSVRVITNDVGGSFAVKIWPYPEQVLALVAARQTRQPVKWVGGRIESFGSDIMGRARVDHARLATDANGKFLGFTIDAQADMGAFLNTAAPLIVTEGSVRTLGNTYRIPATTYTVNAMFTNLVPTDAYRGAGKPESTATLERLIDIAANELGIDPFDLREQNLIQPDDMPYHIPVGVTYDSGNYPELARLAREASDWGGFNQRKSQSKNNGRLRGAGIGFYVHITGGSPAERSDVRALADGTVLVRTGTQDTGQGHRTALAMVAAEALELPLDNIRVEQGDSAWLDQGGGTGGSNLMAIAGNNVHKTSLKMIEQARAVSAELLEASVVDIEYRQGVFSVAGTDRQITLAQVAAGFEQLPEQAKDDAMGAGCVAQLDFEGIHATAPSGAYVCEIELDPETGQVRVDRFTCVDDLGRIFNPQTVDGQLHGSIAQSIGEALMEGMHYDESGQILTGSLMDYPLPRADDVPNMTLRKHQTGSPNSALGVKGVGEVASIGAPGVILNAVHDALKPYGVRHLDMPLTSEKIWRSIQTGRTLPIRKTTTA
ncbi:MAG: xanthine dehydrogenase family protein molybdopterin-binding subunit [Burkholderiaceae bacterium]